MIVHCKQCRRPVPSTNFLQTCSKPSDCYDREPAGMPPRVRPLTDDERISLEQAKTKQATTTQSKVERPEPPKSEPETTRQIVLDALSTSAKPVTQEQPVTVPEPVPVESTKPKIEFDSDGWRTDVSMELRQRYAEEFKPGELLLSNRGPEQLEEDLRTIADRRAAGLIPPRETEPAEDEQPRNPEADKQRPVVKAAPVVQKPEPPVKKPVEKRRYRPRVKSGDQTALALRLGKWLMDHGATRGPVARGKMHRALTLGRHPSWQQALGELVGRRIVEETSLGLLVIDPAKLLALDIETGRKKQKRKRHRPKSQWYLEHVEGRHDDEDEDDASWDQEWAAADEDQASG